MNGNGTRQTSYSTSSRDSRYGAGLQAQIQPSAKVLLDGYRGSLVYDDYSHMSLTNKQYSRSSTLLNPNDPVSMHLLMETAMGDSQQYEVLSFEEADEMKKELAMLTSRIEFTKRKLILESKLRDAALSLNRLSTNKGRDVSGEGSPISPKRHRGSFMGNRSSGGGDLLSKTGSEMAAIIRKCEELAQELWKLEQRAQKLHRALLEHTAGVLQMTHKGYLSKVPPGTPETMHGYSRGSSRLDGGVDEFDERSWYRSHDTLDEFGAGFGSERRQGGSRLISQPPAERAPQIEESARQTDASVATAKRGDLPGSISQKESHVADLRTEHEKMKRALETTDRDAKATEIQLALALERLEAAKQDAILREEQKGMDNDNALKVEKAARKEAEERFFAELQSKEEEISELATKLTDLRDEGEIAGFKLQGKLQESEERLRELSAQLNDVVEAGARFEATEAELKQTAEDKTKEAERIHQEMKGLEGEVVRLHTEVTVARAELDGAYGTRAQRAAEVAANPAIQKELDDLSDRNNLLVEEITALKAQGSSANSGNSELIERVELLQRELAETIGEYEIMTKSTIEFEREREQLEATIDSLRDRCENLDSQLSDEKVRWLGMKSPGSGGRDSLVPSNTSIMVLKNEFKKMMRETRAENMKAIRAEQEERRKLEALVRTLKRDQLPTKSGLSHSMTIH
ncbi:Up-regulated during septation protein 1 [Lasallia pustulata]|uniref:Up-regulated during septation protein 1 n=1 Tax=Lasallia pustulata TaxID=136370 RepID=A0A1W5D852_9LECA|nr:Up-regulated during septation protein 1 [Lasallia pustulata]